MPARKIGAKPAPAKPKARKAAAPAAGVKSAPPAERAAAVVAQLKRLGSEQKRQDMGKRYGITGPSAENAFGVPMSAIKAMGKKLGKDHALAAALWETGNYEARMLASFVGDAQALTPAQMNRWVYDFDNWAYCDALSFNLFDRSPHAFAKVAQWAGRKEEFVRRTAFALLWSLALHDRQSGDAPFEKCLPLIEHAATDDRNFVKKAVSMALRAVGRRSASLNAQSTALAQRLISSPLAAAQWVGRDSIKDLARRH